MNFGLGENDNRNMFFSMMNNINNNMMNNMNNPMMNNMNNNMMNMNNLMNSFMNFNPFFMMNNIHFFEFDSFESQKIERKEGLEIKCDVDRLLQTNHELENKNKDHQTILNYIPFTIT